MNKLVSIITPAYNCAKYISATVISVLKQDYNNWELIIIDDFSTDNTKEIIQEFVEKDKRIKYFLLESNYGTATARNKGIEQANGHYIAFLDSDDLWVENKLSNQIKFMESNTYAFTCTDYEQINEEGQLLNKRIKTKSKTNYNGVLLSCPVGNSTVIYDVSKLGKFKIPNIRKRNDDALWLQILKKEKYIYGLGEVLMYYRVRHNSISSNKFKLIKYHWKLYRDIERLSIIRSIFHICCWIFLKALKIK